MEIVAPENFYNDCEYGDCGTVYYTLEHNAHQYLTLDISPIGAICLKCGKPYSDNEGVLVCTDCDDCEYCESCEGRYAERELNSIDGEGLICDGCLDAYFLTCGYCGESKREETLIAVAGDDPDTLITHICRECVSEKEVPSMKCPECDTIQLVNTHSETAYCYSRWCDRHKTGFPIIATEFVYRQH